MDREQEIQSLLLSWEEYNQTEFSVPYVYSIEKGSQYFIYLGVNHTSDKEDPQFARVDDEWKKFLSLPSKNKVAIGEGHRPPKFGTFDEMVSIAGERGYLSFIAHEAGIPVFSPDPSEKTLWDALLVKYSKDELFFHDVLQIAFQWNNLRIDTSFEEYIKHFTDNYPQTTGWQDYDFSFERIKKLSPGFIGKEFDERDTELFYDLINPSSFETRFNEIGRDIDVIRDTAIVSEIIAQWEKGNSIFAVLGSGHAVIEERALKHFLTVE